MNFRFAALVVWALSGARAHAYPELVRHSYVNCTTCHVSPTGGGLLTEYGRELSREVLSFAGYEGEGAFLYGWVKPPEWLNLGGDLRGLAFYKESPTAHEVTFIPMQMDLEAGVSYGPVTVVGTAGLQVLRRGTTRETSFVSRRHYAMFQASESITVRGGRFSPAFGINIADHMAFTRRDLGFDQGTETYNLEAAYVGEKWNAYATGIFGRLDDSTIVSDKGFALQSTYAFFDTIKAGVSYYFGDSSARTRHVAGMHGIVGFRKDLFWLTEWDISISSPKSGALVETGWATYNRLDFEVLQGLHIFGTGEFSHLNHLVASNQQTAFGLGTQFFPRPHLEVSLQGQYKRQLSVNDQFYPAVYLMMHIYL